MGFKDQNWSHLWEEQNVKGEKKRGGRGRRREKKMRREAKLYKGMELTLGMDSIMDHMNFVWDSRKVYEFQI